MAAGGAGRPATDHRTTPTLLTYMIRRVIGAVILLFVVSVVTFVIFFLVPGSPGHSRDLASRYVGKSAGAAQIHAPP